MRKREIRKLVLTRETVRNLTSEELALAGGAVLQPKVQRRRQLIGTASVPFGQPYHNTGVVVISVGVHCQYDSMYIC